jgi:hypothetical protein
MNAELEKIVDTLLASGELTERSRALLMQKAEKLGVDLLDFELELENKIAQKKASISGPLPIYSSLPPKSNKVGSLKKCPSCGAPVESFKTKCAECGHEFSNISTNSTVEDFILKLNSIEKIVRDEYYKNGENYVVNMFTGEKQEFSGTVINMNIAPRVHKKKVEMISIFEVPNSKEEILTFLAIAIPEATKKISSFLGSNKEAIEIKNAWNSKANNLVFKSRLLFKDDKNTLDEINIFAKQLGIK